MKQTQKTKAMNENQKVSVEYGDNKGNHITTVSELRKKWNQETEIWQNAFFENLEKTGKAYSRFAEYSLK